MGNELHKKNELKKHIATIQCAHTFSLLQRKISNALLFHAYPNLKTIEEHQITVRQLCDFIGYHGHNHAAIKTALKELIATIVEWDLFDDVTGEEDWTASSVLASVRIKGPICYYAYSPRMRELLYSPKIYAKINLIVQAKFKSSYGLALYENCIRYKGIPQTKWFDFDNFKKLMGVAPNHYPIFRDFKRRVLDKAVEEVNLCADLFVEPEIERTGRKVSRIRFILTNRERKKCIFLHTSNNYSKVGMSESENNLVDDELIKKLNNQFLIGIEKSKSLIQQYGKDSVKEKIKFLEATASYKKGEINNLSGYLIDSLKKDYKQLSSRDNLTERKKQEYVNEEAKKNMESKKPEYIGYLKKTLEKYISSFDNNEQENLREQFKKYIQKNNPLILEYNIQKNNGLFDPCNQETIELIVHGLLINHPRLSSVFMSFDHYCASQSNIMEKGTLTG